MFYILYGQDDFSRHQALEKVKKELGDSEMLAANTSLLDGEHLNLVQLRDACTAYPSLLCPSRLVIVEGLLKRFEPKTKQKHPINESRTKRGSALKEWQGLGEYIGQMSPTTVLILVDGKIERNNPLLKSLSPIAKVMTFPLLQDKDLGDWIQEQVKQRNGTITRGAVKLLTELVGGDLFAMGNELDKLLTYGSEPNITEDNVRQLTAYAREANIFALVDAILEGRTKVAQQLLHKIIQEGRKNYTWQ